MQTRPSYAIVGLFVTLLTGLVIVAGVWFGFGDPKPPSRPYITYVSDSVAGMRENSTVRYRGVDVGRVREIDLDPGDPRRVRLLLDIDLEVPILTGTVARLSTQGLTGLSYIELSSDGSGTTLTAREGETYPVIKSQSTFMGRIDAAGTELLARVGEMTLHMTEASRRISELFNDSNREAIAATLADLRLVAAALGTRADTVGRGVDDLGSVLADAAHAGEKLPGLVDRADRTLAGIDRHAVALADAARAIERLAVTVEGESKRLGGGLDRATALTEQELARFASETQPAMVHALREIEGAAIALRRLGEVLERDPSLLLYGQRERALGPGEGGKQ